MSLQQIKKIVISNRIFIIIMIGLLGLIIYHNNIYQNTFTGIAKVYDISVHRHSVHHINYKYFVNSKIYYGNKKVMTNQGKKYLNKFFEIEISSKDFKWSKIDLEREVYDKTLISDAGFKKYNYD